MQIHRRNNKGQLAFQQGLPRAVSRQPAGRKERQWLGFSVDQKDLNLDQTSREALGNALEIVSPSAAWSSRSTSRNSILCDTPHPHPQEALMVGRGENMSFTGEAPRAQSHSWSKV